MRRYTFVVQVYPEGIATLENLTTHQQIEVSDLDAVGRQIGVWVHSLPAAAGASQMTPTSSEQEET